MNRDHDTIAAPATAAGGAIAVIRVSGAEALAVCDRIFHGREPLAQAAGYTVHFGRIADGDAFVDEVLATVFRAPHSYTGEDSVELSCHGSPFIVSEILRLLRASGARMAEPGEFTIRAYLAGKLDLAQAEAVADLIASSSRSAHALAANQLRGGISGKLDGLRERLLHLTSLLELELDFSEEDVQFADREQLRATMEEIGREIASLRESFALGNALKEGVPVAIAGAPNVGKSTLLNRLLGEERAMVSEIAGTTRDVIEERVNIDGVVFRFLDTAGIRQTDDRLERMGIRRTMQSIARARIVIRMLDAASLPAPSAENGSPAGPDVADAAIALVADRFGQRADDLAGINPDECSVRGASADGNTQNATASSACGLTIDHKTGNPDECSVSGSSADGNTQNIAANSACGLTTDHKTGNPDENSACGRSGDPDVSSTNRPTTDAKTDNTSGSGPATWTAESAGNGKTNETTDGPSADGKSGDLSDLEQNERVLYDPAGRPTNCGSAEAIEHGTAEFSLREDQTLLTVVNKIDTRPGQTLPEHILGISARNGEGIDALRKALRAAVDTEALYHGDTVVSNSRHHEALVEAHEALQSALDGLRNDLPADLLSEDVRRVIRHIGVITARGEIAPDEVLGNIFSKFCIGK